MSTDCSKCEGYRVSMIIQVEIKTVYGEERIYPACAKASVFAKLVGQKTLTRRDINNIKELGYTIEVVQAKAVL